MLSLWDTIYAVPVFDYLEVSGLKFCVCGVYDHTELLSHLHFECLTQVWILQLLPLQPQAGEAGVATCQQQRYRHTHTHTHTQEDTPTSLTTTVARRAVARPQLAVMVLTATAKQATASAQYS